MIYDTIYLMCKQAINRTMDEDWDPLAEDFADPTFNTYDRGPAKGLGPATRFDDG
jgi:hypothetical protein